MLSIPIDVAASDRTCWLAELSATLGEAQRLLLELDLSDLSRSAGAELFQRIEAVQLEIRSLSFNRSMAAHDQNAPEWTDFSPWQIGPGPRA